MFLIEKKDACWSHINHILKNMNTFCELLKACFLFFHLNELDFWSLYCMILNCYTKNTFICGKYFCSFKILRQFDSMATCPSEGWKLEGEGFCFKGSAQRRLLGFIGDVTFGISYQMPIKRVLIQPVLTFMFLPIQIGHKSHCNGPSHKILHYNITVRFITWTRFMFDFLVLI